jgi:hypothetical protein
MERAARDISGDHVKGEESGRGLLLIDTVGNRGLASY